MLGSDWAKSSYSFANGNCVEARWAKASASHANGNCAEIRRAPGGGVQVRDSKDPEGPVLTFTTGKWAAFRDGVKAGEFDHLG